MGLMVTERHMMIGGGLLLAAGVLYVWSKGVKGAAEATAKAAVDVAAGASTGVINGVSEIVGVPVPERSKCDLAKQTGSTWDASLYCPAGEFVGYLFN